MQAEYAAEDKVLDAAGTNRATLEQDNAEIASKTAEGPSHNDCSYSTSNKT